MVSAQQKGDIYVGGNLGVGVTSVIMEGESVTAVEFSIQPNVGYFVANKFMVGFGLGANIVGFEYQPTERIGLSASLLSLDCVILSEEGLTLNTVNLGLTLSPSIGFKYYF